MRARNASDPTAPIPGGSKRNVRGFHAAASLGVLALMLVSVAACAPSSDAGSGAAAKAEPLRPAGPAAQSSLVPSSPAPSVPAPSVPVPSAAAPLPAGPGSGSSPDPVLAAAKARVEAALGSAVAGGAKPVTDRIRTALTAAGFTPDQAEVTAGRTPTGLDADAVEAAVRVGDDCIIGQLRTGTVTVAVFPVLSDGRCLVGTRV